MRFLKYSFILIFFFAYGEVLYAENEIPSNDEKPTLFQIEDKYHEVKLSLTKSSVYMQVKSSVKDYINQEIVQRHNIEASQFIDSQGHFLLGDIVLLNSDKIEYSFDDIDDVTFEDGVLTFSYNNVKSFTFSDILGTDGNPALDNFYVEDLEKFYLNYKKLAS
tara:strand:+ start:18033 stop:18521 length:489 start_codon:yes stop_codon:yes gene_type:complete